MASRPIVSGQDLLEAGTLNVFSLTVVRPDGDEETHPWRRAKCWRLSPQQPQATRGAMSVLYLTPNPSICGHWKATKMNMPRLFSEAWDGVWTFIITHLFKQGVPIARHWMAVAIQKRTPQRTTARRPAGGVLFPFALRDLDLILVCHGTPGTAAEVGASWIGQQGPRVFDDLRRKQTNHEFLGRAPMLDAP